MDDTDNQDFAGAHIALFIAWLAKRKFLNSNVFDEVVIASWSDGDVSVNLLMSSCDGTVMDEFVVPQERAFVTTYYSPAKLKGWSCYFSDIAEKIIGVERMYKVGMDDIDTEKAFAMLDKRHEEWVEHFSKQKVGFFAKLLAKLNV